MSKRPTVGATLAYGFACPNIKLDEIVDILSSNPRLKTVSHGDVAIGIELFIVAEKSITNAWLESTEFLGSGSLDVQLKWTEDLLEAAKKLGGERKIGWHLAVTIG